MKTRTLHCDSCEILAINNIACHEHGCPDAWKYSTVECNWCGVSFEPEEPNQTFCAEDCAESYNG